MKLKCDNCGKFHDYSDCKPARCPDDDCLGLCYEPPHGECKQPIKDGDYILTDHMAWLETGGLSIRIYRSHEGMFLGGGVHVDIYRNGEETESPVASVFAPDDFKIEQPTRKE